MLSRFAAGFLKKAVELCRLPTGKGDISCTELLFRGRRAVIISLQVEPQPRSDPITPWCVPPKACVRGAAVNRARTGNIKMCFLSIFQEVNTMEKRLLCKS